MTRPCVALTRVSGPYRSDTRLQQRQPLSGDGCMLALRWYISAAYVHTRSGGALVAFGVLMAAFPATSEGQVPSEQVLTKRLNAIRYADQFPGGNAGAKIAAALADLPSTGGTIDARGLTGAQTIATPLTLGVSTDPAKPTTLLLGPGNFTVSNTITVLKQCAVMGTPIGLSVGYQPPAHSGTFLRASSPNLPSVVQIGDGINDQSGFAAVLQDMVIDGGGSQGGTQSAAVIVNRSGRVCFA